MEIKVSDNNQVYKFKHSDNSETTIKTVPSYSIVDGQEVVEERNKYSIFISSEVNCHMQCSFCYLTLENQQPQRLSNLSILKNVKHALEHVIEKDPTITSRYVKLCWMGMGDAGEEISRVRDITADLLLWIMNNRYAVGVDGVDISTVLPKSEDLYGDFNWYATIINITEIGQYPLNPLNKSIQRTPFRIFYSLHSAIQETRDEIIPGAITIIDALDLLISHEPKIIGYPNVILHHMFLEGINDSEEEVNALIDLLTQVPFVELRILRYNQHPNSDITESSHFDEIVNALQSVHPKVKLQVSKGESIQAACGQFLTQ